MKILEGTQERIAKVFMKQAIEAAKNATCTRSQCGAVIVRDEEIIGMGFNSPPHDDESQRRCNRKKNEYDLKVTDKTCCVHAEQRAIMHALQQGSLEGSRLYFIRIRNGEVTRAGKPYCTICSKMALDTGITEFVLWHEEGICVYDTKEYNDLSFAYAS